MMIRNTPKVYDTLLSYHTQVRDFYKQLPETSKLIKDITWEWNVVVKDGYKITTLDMHDMLSHASFNVEDHEIDTVLFQGDEALSTDYDLCCKEVWAGDSSNYQVKGVVYMYMPSYMCKSGKFEYLHVLHKPEFDDLADVLSKSRRFHF
jgi:hypothetical protein